MTVTGSPRMRKLIDYFWHLPMYRCAVLHMNDPLSLLLRHWETISSTSRQFLKLLDVIIACTTELCTDFVRRTFAFGLSTRLLLLDRLSEDMFVVGFSKRLLLRLRTAVVLASSMVER